MSTFIRRAQPFALALLLALAVQAGWVFATALAASFVEGLAESPITYTGESVELTSEAAPVIVRSTWVYSPVYSHRTETLDPRDRSPIQVAAMLPAPMANLAPAVSFSRSRWERVMEAPIGALGAQRQGADIARTVQRSSRVYFVLSDADMSRGYFELYSVDSRDRQGYIGTRGFRETKPPVEEQFQSNSVDQTYVARDGGILWQTDLEQLHRQIDARTPNGASAAELVSDTNPPFSSNQAVLCSNGRALVVDVAERTVTPLHPATDVTAIGLAARPQPGDGVDAEYVLYVALRTRSQLILVHPRSSTTYEYPLPPDLEPDAIGVWLLSDGTAVVAQSEPVGELDRPAAYDMQLWKVTPEGDIARLESISLRYTPYTGEFGGRANSNLLAFGAGSPAALASVGAMAVSLAEFRARRIPIGEQVTQFLALAWPTILLVIALGAVMAWLADRHFRSVRLPRSWGWLAFVFLFGVPGYCGFRLHRRWPVANGLEEPRPLGTEVFVPWPA